MGQKLKQTTVRPTRIGALDMQVVAAIAKHGQIADYHDTACIHLRGDGDPRLSVVISGGVSLSNTDANGRRIQIVTLCPGEMFGIHQVISNVPYTHDAFAVGQTRIASFDRKAVDFLLERHKQFREGLLVYLSDRLVRALSLIETERRHPLLIRLAKHLYANRDLATGAVTGSQSSHAEVLGVSRNALGTCLQHLNSAGLVTIGRSRIQIPSAAKLAAWIQHETAPD